jgi:hypothetical protein
MRENTVFPEDCMSNIRSKIKMKKLLSNEEICDFVIYLAHNKDIINNDKVRNNHVKGMKKLIINQLRKMLYIEQKYNYYNIKNII